MGDDKPTFTYEHDITPGGESPADFSYIPSPFGPGFVPEGEFVFPADIPPPLDLFLPTPSGNILFRNNFPSADDFEREFSPPSRYCSFTSNPHADKIEDAKRLIHAATHLLPEVQVLASLMLAVYENTGLSQSWAFFLTAFGGGVCGGAAFIVIGYFVFWLAAFIGIGLMIVGLGAFSVQCNEMVTKRRKQHEVLEMMAHMQETEEDASAEE
jgi:hypothetical protein